MKKCGNVMLVAVFCLGLIIAPRATAYEGGKVLINDFSGKYREYGDDQRNFRIKVPVEFTISSKGMFTVWSGKVHNYDGTIMVSVVEMPGQTAKEMYDRQFNAAKMSSTLCEVNPLTIESAGGAVLGYQCKDTESIGPSAAVKPFKERHSWYTYIFLDNWQYLCQASGPFSAFKSGVFPPVYQEVLKSFAITSRSQNSAPEKKE